VVVGDETLTFEQLYTCAGRLAAAISTRVDRGDRVVMIGDNSSAWIQAYYGVPWAGAVLVPINQRLTAAEQAQLVALAEPTVILAEAAYLDALEPFTDELSTVHYRIAVDSAEWAAWTGDGATLQPLELQDAAESAWMLFTSGTTGLPKGAVLSHRALTTAVMSISWGRPVDEDDVFISAYPLCHVSGIIACAYHLHRRPVVILRRFDARGFVEATIRHQATKTSMAPTMLTAVLNELDRSGLELPSLRAMGFGAAPMPPAVLRRAEARLNVSFEESYGMTETAGAAVFLGRPSPMCTARIVDDDMNELPAGDIGEIALRGDALATEYWRDHDATAEAFRNGWLRTGDLGQMSLDDGRLRVVGRKKDIIITGGENVMAREVEDVIHEHPDVAAAAVIGVEDAYWGEAVCAFLVVREGAQVTDDEVCAHVAARLARFKVPRRIFWIDTLPTNPSGKVVKPELRAEARRRVAEAESAAE